MRHRAILRLRGHMSEARIGRGALGRLMPLHMVVNSDGAICQMGPTLQKLVPHVTDTPYLFDLFEFQRPSDIKKPKQLFERVGQKFHLALRADPQTVFKGLGVKTEISAQPCILINMSAGIHLPTVVDRFALSSRDFAPTDLTMEMLYLIEAKSAVMSELKLLNNRLHGQMHVAQKEALTDCLTGIGNRRALDEIIKRATLAGEQFTLLVIDLNGFKSINDSFGHATGDFVLQHVARVLRSETREGDVVARFGGDEFVVLYKDMNDPELVSEAVDRIVTKLSYPLKYAGHSIPVSAGFGVAFSHQHVGKNPRELLNAADKAMYAAKSGRAKVVFSPPPDSQAETHHRN